MRIEDPFTRRNTKPMPMVVNRPVAGYSTPGGDQASPIITVDTSFNSTIKTEAEQVELVELTGEDIRNEDLLRSIAGENEEAENMQPAQGDGAPSPPAGVVDKPPAIVSFCL